jgi:acyl-CoA thioesterase FadM
MVKVACVSVNTSRPVALPETIYQQLKIAEAEDMKKKEMV